METIEFKGFNKIPRFNRDIIITEKIDGTNAQIFIAPDLGTITLKSGAEVPFLVGSRNRWIQPENDNHGFAKWAYANAKDLKEILGPGQHFGEWWGPGIQRGYGLARKKFSLFNVSKWTGLDRELEGGDIGCVPTIHEGGWFLPYPDGPKWALAESLRILQEEGSLASPGFMRPEGVVIYHTASGQLFKVTLEGDDKPKGMAP